MTTPDLSVASRYQQPSSLWRWLLCLLAATAAGLGALLLTKSLTGSHLPGCSASGAFDCDSVLVTRWSHVLGVPVSVPAIVVYLAVLFALQLSAAGSAARRRRAWMGLIVLAGAILASAAWFIALQVHMGSYCLYCMLAHGTGVILALLLLILAPRGRRRINPDDANEPPDPLMVPAGLLVMLMLAGVGGTGLLVAGQWFSHPPTHEMIQLTGGHADFDTGPGPNREISILSGKVRLRPHDYPVMGSADADHLLVYLFDYTCPNCRALHHQFEQAVKDFNGKLGIVMLTVPLDHQCNPYVSHTAPIHQGACDLAKLSIALWLADRAHFAAYDQWLSQDEYPPSPEKARQKAVDMVGETALAAALHQDTIDARIAANITLYGLTGGSVVPQFIMGPAVIFSRPDPDQMYKLLEDQLGLKRDQPAATRPDAP